VCADPRQGARRHRAEKPHQGVRRKKSAPHQDVTWSKSTTALGLPGVWLENRSGESYRTRYYSPDAGRFISEDPARFRAGPNFFNYALGNPISGTDPFGLATLNYWGSQFYGPWLQRWGHVSLTLDDGTYISFYPADFSLVHPNGPGIFSPSLSDDNLNEGGKPDVQIKLDNLDENAIKAWWDNYKKTNPEFRGFTNNCSTVVKNAFDIGGGRKHATEYGTGFLYWEPDAVREYARELQKAGTGIYVEPREPFHVTK
jgi:RHS repeat-associated protein